MPKREWASEQWKRFLSTRLFLFGQHEIYVLALLAKSEQTSILTDRTREMDERKRVKPGGYHSVAFWSMFMTHLLAGLEQSLAFAAPSPFRIAPNSWQEHSFYDVSRSQSLVLYAWLCLFYCLFEIVHLFSPIAFIVRFHCFKPSFISTFHFFHVISCVWCADECVLLLPPTSPPPLPLVVSKPSAVSISLSRALACL